MRFSSPGRVVPLLLLGLLALANRAIASRWVEVGTAGASLDKVMVDTDSVRKIEQFTVVDIMTVYGAPRTNAHDIMLDRHVQRTAFDCANRSFIGIQTTGYLNGKRVGGSPVTADWQTRLTPLGKDPMAARIYAIACSQSGASGASAESPRPKIRSGSGIVVDRHGDILTNGHVVNGCKSIIVKTSASTPVAAIIDSVDPRNDLAVIKTVHDTTIGVPARFRHPSKPGRLGESIGVIGYPLTGILSAEPKATFGQINSVAGYNNDYTLLQISAPVQPGNSGGPVLDSSGLVVGVVVAQVSPAVANVVGSVPQNVNFAIRGELAQIFLAARGIKVATGEDWRTLATEAVAAEGEKSTVFILCAE